MLLLKDTVPARSFAMVNGTLEIVAGTQSYGGVAWWAHAGGFITGIVQVGLFARRQYVRPVYADEYRPW